MSCGSRRTAAGNGLRFARRASASLPPAVVGAAGRRRAAGQAPFSSGDASTASRRRLPATGAARTRLEFAGASRLQTRDARSRVWRRKRERGLRVDGRRGRRCPRRRPRSGFLRRASRSRRACGVGSAGRTKLRTPTRRASAASATGCAAEPADDLARRRRRRIRRVLRAACPHPPLPGRLGDRGGEEGRQGRVDRGRRSPDCSSGGSSRRLSPGACACGGVCPAARAVACDVENPSSTPAKAEPSLTAGRQRGRGRTVACACGGGVGRRRRDGGHGAPPAATARLAVRLSAASASRIVCASAAGLFVASPRLPAPRPQPGSASVATAPPPFEWPPAEPHPKGPSFASAFRFAKAESEPSRKIRAAFW